MLNSDKNIESHVSRFISLVILDIIFWNLLELDKTLIFPSLMRYVREFFVYPIEDIHQKIDMDSIVYQISAYGRVICTIIITTLIIIEVVKMYRCSKCKGVKKIEQNESNE